MKLFYNDYIESFENNYKSSIDDLNSSIDIAFKL